MDDKTVQTKHKCFIGCIAKRAYILHKFNQRIYSLGIKQFIDSFL